MLLLNTRQCCKRLFLQLAQLDNELKQKRDAVKTASASTLKGDEVQYLALTRKQK